MLPVTYADAQAVVLDYLRPLLDPVPVHLRVPDTRPGTFVTVRRVGGTANVLIDSARLDLFAWGATDPEAHDLCMTLRRLLPAMPGPRGATVVTTVAEFSGPVLAPDASRQPRWMITYEIGMRGTA
jgi:hypothetical protein